MNIVMRFDLNSYIPVGLNPCIASRVFLSSPRLSFDTTAIVTAIRVALPILLILYTLDWAPLVGDLNPPPPN